jgi:serine/threonine protein kinase
MQFGPGLQCKLIDFGLCTHIDDIRSIAGSFHYFSPKLKKLQYNPSLKLKTNPFKDDVYSFGMTLYEVITRRIGQASAKWGNSRYARDVFHHTKNN